MKVFLKQDVPNLGKANDVKDVSDGYARNYLFPKGLAMPANKGNIKAAQALAETQKVHETRLREHALDIAEQLEHTPLRFKARAGETGRLYGSITSADIAATIERALGIEFDKRWLVLEHPIRDVGKHVVEVKLGSGVRGQAHVIVETEA